MNNRHYRFVDKYSTDHDDLVPDKFKLHSHPHYEIYLFLKGDSKYVIEDKVYSANPLDLFIIRKHEFHQAVHNSYAPYHRIYMHISADFFKENNCPSYENIFLTEAKIAGNKIPASVVRSSGLYDVIMKYKKYSNNYQDKDIPVLKSLIVEILHLLNQTTTRTTSNYTNPVIHSVITYLNEHFTENITLDMLENTFFVSKYYLCRIFNEATGLTIHDYITKKRLAKAVDLKNEGVAMGDIAWKCGFGCYSSFSRAYHKEFGQSPKK